MDVLQLVTAHLDYLLLMMLRVSGLFISNPIFGRKNVPNLIKLALCLALTVAFVFTKPLPDAPLAYSGSLEYALACLSELSFGLAMGFVTTAMFNVVFTAGSLMDMQIGFSMVNIYDIQNSTQVSVTGDLFNIMLIVMFFGVDGHLRLIDIIYATLDAVPIGNVSISPDIVWTAARIMADSFILAVMLAMPVTAAGLLTEIALGAIIRTVPQMNMFVIGIPLKIVIGLAVLAGSLSLFTAFSRELGNQMFGMIDAMFAAIITPA